MVDDEREELPTIFLFKVNYAKTEESNNSPEWAIEFRNDSSSKIEKSHEACYG